MFGFGRKKKRQEEQATASTFVEATGGGWDEAPNVLPGDGGEHADYVGEMLRKAREYALENDIEVGEEFEFTITDIPMGIAGPHAIILGVMMRADEYGLMPGAMLNETAYFTRVR